VITPPAHWTQHHGVHLVTLYPPEGGGRIRVYERLRPLPRLSEVVAFVVDRDPAFRVTGLYDATELVTTEGEHGAWVRVAGRRDDAPVVRLVGAVYGDEYALAIDTLVVVPERATQLEAVTRGLLLGASLGLGVRRRRYRYAPPPGWSAIPTGLIANWYPPDYPANRTNLVVLPAEPSTDDPETTFARFLAGEREGGRYGDGAITEAPLVTDDGLAGRRWSFDGVARGPGPAPRHELAAFGDAPYLYVLRMESRVGERVDEHRAIFDAVARSVRPVPAAGRPAGFGGAPPPSEAFGHWFD